MFPVTISLIIEGFPFPFVSFIHCPTKYPKTFVFPFLYSSTIFLLLSRTFLTTASNSSVFDICSNPGRLLPAILFSSSLLQTCQPIV